MKVFNLNRKQVLPISLSEAWDYFSNANNLAKITPPELALRIKNPIQEKVFNGMIIEYDVTPMLGLKMNWLTELKCIEEPYMFVDEQRFGPYKFWYHQHRFKEVEGGVEVEDNVYYGLPLGIFSGLANQLFIKKQLKHIFDFRRKVLAKEFSANDTKVAE